MSELSEYHRNEQYAYLIETFLNSGYITLEDLLPAIRKGTSRMVGEPEDKIFKSPRGHEDV